MDWVGLVQVAKWLFLVLGGVGLIVYLRWSSQQATRKAAVDENERKEAEGNVQVQEKVIEKLAEPTPDHAEWSRRQRERLSRNKGKHRPGARTGKKRGDAG